MLTDTSHTISPKVLIVGGGFAGLACARALGRSAARIVLADQNNYHLFQPLLYQVATAVLSPADIASPIRRILRDQPRTTVVLEELTHVDFDAHEAHFKHVTLAYDYLVLACGATHSYFGHGEWACLAPGLKSVDDALEIRRRVLLAYEEAEWEADEAARRAKLTFVVVGGGPTGVELAGALKEIAAKTIPADFRNIDTTTARVVLVQGGARLLEGMPEKLGARAKQDLESMGVEVRLNSHVTDIRPGQVLIGDTLIPAENIVWAAGVKGASVCRNLDCELDRQGRIKVGPDLALPGHPEVFVVGDLASATDMVTGLPVPGLAPAAMQMGSHVAGVIQREMDGDKGPREAFQYHDRGSMATIGRNRAVARVGRRQFYGFGAWALWSIVHILPLVGFRSRLFVVLSWILSYFSAGKSVRLITGRPPFKVKQAINELDSSTLRGQG